MLFVELFKTNTPRNALARSTNIGPFSVAPPSPRKTGVIRSMTHRRNARVRDRLNRADLIGCSEKMNRFSSTDLATRLNVVINFEADSIFTQMFSRENKFCIYANRIDHSDSSSVARNVMFDYPSPAIIASESENDDLYDLRTVCCSAL